eukprot:2138149-Amphidinium_carterae.2
MGPRVVRPKGRQFLSVLRAGMRVVFIPLFLKVPPNGAEPLLLSVLFPLECRYDSVCWRRAQSRSQRHHMHLTA